MKMDWLVKTLLGVIAVLLGVNALRPLVSPPAVRAQGGEAYSFYIEPGVTMLRAPDGSRQVYGKVVVDLRNGKVWGFPTTAQDVPVPDRPRQRWHADVAPFPAGEIRIWRHGPIAGFRSASILPAVARASSPSHGRRDARRTAAETAALRWSALTMQPVASTDHRIETYLS